MLQDFPLQRREKFLRHLTEHSMSKNICFGAIQNDSAGKSTCCAWVSCPEPTKWKERTNSPNLSSDLQIHSGTSSHTHYLLNLKYVWKILYNKHHIEKLCVCIFVYTLSRGPRPVTQKEAVSWKAVWPWTPHSSHRKTVASSTVPWVAVD